jgi:hypothetical protein
VVGSVFGWDAFLDSIFKCADAGDTPPKSGEIAPPSAAYWRCRIPCGEEGAKLGAVSRTVPLLIPWKWIIT